MGAPAPGQWDPCVWSRGPVRPSLQLLAAPSRRFSDFVFEFVCERSQIRRKSQITTSERFLCFFSRYFSPFPLRGCIHSWFSFFTQ